MPEKWNPQDNTLHFVAEAITDEELCNKMLDSHDPEKGFTVSLTINGVEVPFVKTIDAVYKLFEEEINARAADLVKQKLELRRVNDLIERFEHDIEQELRKIFNLK